MRARRKIAVLGVLIVIAAGLWWFWGREVGTQEVGGGRTVPQTITSNGVKVSDFTQAADRIHAVVDQQIQAGRGTPKLVAATVQEVPRTGVEGKIRWHVRQLQLQLPQDTSVDSWLKSLETALKPRGAEVLGRQAEGQQGIRIDVGIRDQLGGEKLTLVTDKILILGVGEAKRTEKKRTPISGKAQLAIVVDDFGYTQEPIQAYVNLGRQITFAVLPNRPYSQEAAQQALRHGLTVMLHMPMEALSASATVEPVTVNVDMADSEVQATARRLVDSLPGISGVNNHQGSKATADARVMAQVLEVVKGRGLFFVDSRTNPRSVALDTARRMGLRSTENEIFLDNSNEVGAVKQQIRAAANLALRQGSAVAIGHARMTTVMALQEMLPELDEMGVKLVPITQLLQ